eukprot:jgi/Ulvmu1/12651/UM094_0007.1
MVHVSSRQCLAQRRLYRLRPQAQTKTKQSFRGRNTTVCESQVAQLLCFGSGLSATSLCDSVGHQSTCYLTSRSPDSAKSSSHSYVLFDGAEHPIQDPSVIQSASHILISIPPDVGLQSDPVLRLHYDDIVISRCSWLGYLSSTAVYGDWQGEEVNETSPLLAKSDKLQARIAAEQQWMEAHNRHGVPVHVFRLGGIYGPGRSLLDAVRRMQQGKTSSSQRRRAQQATTARIHVEDVTQALLLSMEHPTPGQVFNLVDDDCAGRNSAMAFASELLQRSLQKPGASAGMEQPDEQQLQSPPAGSETKIGSETKMTASVGMPSLSQLAEGGGETAQEGRGGGGRGEKRVSNAKAKRVLGWKPLFPSYREGLAQIAAVEQQEL